MSISIRMNYFLFLLGSLLIVLRLACAGSVVNEDGTMTHHFHFKVHYTNVTRLCHSKQLVAVNGLFPGPTVYVRQGDRVNVKVSNYVTQNISIHWHGVRQMYSVWSDGPAYITQCPVRPNTHFTHRFTVVREQGTLFWHAHLSWLRATLYGAFIIQPKYGKPYPFPVQPTKDFPIVLGEWWNMDVLDVEKFGLENGGGYNLSNATTINGQPGLLYRCSQEDTTRVRVKQGETYLLRVINAAMNFQMFFQVAKHKLTVVETDCSLSKPYTTNVIVLAPGQTADVLVTANQTIDSYVMAASAYSPARADFVPHPNTTTTALFAYEGSTNKTLQELYFPPFPAANDSHYALHYVSSLRSLNSKAYPSPVPQTVNNQSFLFTVGYSVEKCPAGQTCHGPQGQRVSTSINNITFVAPNISILQAYYESRSDADLSGISPSIATNIFQTDFPSEPLYQYNYTGPSIEHKFAMRGTKVKVVDFETNVQLVLQNTQTLFFESHPFHLHGYNFYVVGMGLGNYNASSDPYLFNLIDPPAMNTIAVPLGGWVALRFFTDNPGVWLMHCHFEMHTSWGMQMVWIVKEGEKKLPLPPKDYPKC